MAGRIRSRFRWRRGSLKHFLTVFLACLLTSTLFWFLLAFHGYYTTRIRVPVQYINIPEDRTLFGNLPDEIELEISGDGYQLLSYKIRPENAALVLNGHDIGYKTRSGKAFFVTAESIDYFNRLHTDIKAIQSFPDTIFFDFFNQGYRKVPINLRRNLSFQKSFGLGGDILIQPDSVHVSGPAVLLDSIQSIETEMLTLSEINQNYAQMLRIIQPVNGIDFAPAEVYVSIPVERYTEAVLYVPLQVNGLMQRDCVEVKPSLLKLICSVSLSKYQTLHPDSFSLNIDIRQLKGKKLKVNLDKKPKFVENIRILPDYVDCLIRK